MGLNMCVSRNKGKRFGKYLPEIVRRVDLEKFLLTQR